MEQKHAALFKPFCIGKVEIRNRYVVGPFGTM